MAYITKSNKDNFLKWEKVTGTYTLAQLQAVGMPPRRSELEGDYNSDYNSDYKKLT